MPAAVSVVRQEVAEVPAAKSVVGFQRPSSLAAATARAAIAAFTPSPLAQRASWLCPSSSSAIISSIVIGASLHAMAVKATRDRPSRPLICENTCLSFYL